jgi:hypothetical protein
MSIESKDRKLSCLLECQRLVDLIEQNADDLARNWVLDVQNQPEMVTYHSYDKDILHERIFTVFSHLGRWISEETTKEEIANHYRLLGAERREEGFALSEVVYDLILSRRHIWLKVLEEGVLDTALEMSQAMDLQNRVMRFFDRAIYFTIMGYENRS